MDRVQVEVQQVGPGRFRICDNSSGNCPEVEFDTVTGTATLVDDFGGSVTLSRQQWDNFSAAMSTGLVSFPTA